MPDFRNLITYGVFPLTFVAAHVATYVAVRSGVSTDFVLASVMVGTAVWVLILERVHPEHGFWNRSQDDVVTDGLHALVSQILLPHYLEAALRVVLAMVVLRFAGTFHMDIWPSGWSMWLQVPLALIVCQFFEYWAHRCMHEVPLLWRLHATHHSPGRLYFLNAARFHPLDTALSVFVSFTPLMLLGVSDQVLVHFVVWVTVHGLFQHCNVRLRLGPLNYIFSMAELHRWHHSRVLEEANNNYGNNIILWDIVFGTLYWPRDRDPSPDVGLSDMPHFPQGYVGQLLSPFRWKKVQKNQASGV